MARATKAAVPGMPTHVALLRGINVGGKHLLPMADLAGFFADAGCTGVRTYIQSGNVVFGASAGVAKRVGTAVGGMIAEKFGFEPRIMIRTREAIEEVACGNPFVTDGCDHKVHHVGFLEKVPDAGRVAALDPKRAPNDRFLVRGDVIYVHYATSIVDSKLSGPYIDTTLGMSSTFRNWRTVLKLVEMLGSPG